MEIEEHIINDFNDFNRLVSEFYNKGFTFFRGDKVIGGNEENLLLNCSYFGNF